MAYLEQNDPNIIDDIQYRKEFAIYSNINELKKEETVPRFLVRDLIGKEYGLKLHSYQNFVENFMNPNTPNTRLFMQWSPGMGKTIGSLSIALKFINYYNKIQNSGSDIIGSVWILGFSENIFRSDLIKFPEFGFISESELQIMNNLKELIHQGSSYDIEKLNEFRIKINKRLSNRQGNGFFKFMGYKSLLNRLFLSRDKDINLTSLPENEIMKLINENKIVLNKELLEEMNNSLLICDEIHDVYNSAEKNNWGVALQTILNYDNTIRALFLSATPFNNSPTELIDLLNLLTPKTHFPEYKKTDFFTTDEKLIESKKLELYDILKGRISFITNNDPKYFPAKNFIGKKIPGINYLKFIRCEMSSFHYNTYKTSFSESNTLPSDSQYIVDFALPDPREKDEWKSIGLYKTGDIRSVYSNISPQWRSKFKLNYDEINDILSGEILNLENGHLNKISSKYYQMVKDIINLVSNKKGKIFIYHNVIHMSGVLFIGEILKANGFISENANSVDGTRCAICGKKRKEHSKEQLIIGGKKIKRNYSLEIINIKNVKCKKYSMNTPNMKISFIIDPYELGPNEEYVKNGKILVEQKDIQPLDMILQRTRQDVKEWIKLLTEYKIFPLSKNYYYFASPKSKVKNLERLELLQLIGKMLDAIPEFAKDFFTYGGNDDHHYMPCRYTLIHSKENRKVINQNIDAFNSINNVWGDHLMILVGGKIMKQSINLVAVQNLMIMGRPDNIPTMLQINGRAIRTNSHILLPPENRLVNISIYTSTLPNNKLSYEEEKYKEKIESFKTIQELELILHEVAIDKEINYDIIFQPQSELQKKQHYELDILPYKKSITKKYKLEELNLDTFNAYYGQEEINNIRLIIKKIFIEQSPVWKYNDLLNAVRNIKNVIERDMSLISEHNFILALDALLIKDNDKYIEPIINNINDSNVSLYKKLTNPLEKYIYMLNGNKYGIVHIGEFYMMMPINITGEPIIDIEMPFRTKQVLSDFSINIQEYLLYDAKTNYYEKRDKFIKKWENIDIRNLELSFCDYGTSFHKKFAQECIEYIFNIWTNPLQSKSPYHLFYFKMLYFYDLRKIIIWAHTLSNKEFENYKKWAIPYNEKLNEEKDTDKSTSGLINLIKTSINHDKVEWISTGMVNDFNSKIKESLELFEGSKRKKNTKTKVPANYLPVGHFIGNTPKFYNPDKSEKWYNNMSYLEKTKQYKENSIIIGYDDKSKSGLNVKFKLRTPIQNIKQYKDSRQIEKGAVCSTKSKQFLKQISKQLGLKDSDYIKSNIDELCKKIRNRLIYYELKERQKNSNIKYFYFLHEIKPETIIDNIE
jgi:hypothetical protein